MVTFMKNSDGFKQTKIEKTSDHTFNVHTEDGGHFECQSNNKLSKLKTVTHVKQDSTFKGIGTKKELACDHCKKIVTKLQGTFDKEFKKIFYYCTDCKSKI